MEKLTDALLPDIETPSEHRLKDDGRAISHVEGAGLQEFHALLKEIDQKQTWGGLRRVTAKASGDVLWACPKHYKIYDPDLPKQKRASRHQPS